MLNSSNPSVASVTKGIIRTVSPGIATISGNGLRIILIVKNNLNDPNPVVESEWTNRDPAESVSTLKRKEETAETIKEKTEDQNEEKEKEKDDETEEKRKEEENAEKESSIKKKEKKTYPVCNRIWNDEIDYPVLVNIIGAVESGGQVYGERNYGCYIKPNTNSKKETTITIGWPQFYGNRGRELLKRIYDEDEEEFLKIDSKNRIAKMLDQNWEGWNPNRKQKNIIISLLTSKEGKKCQDAMFLEEMKECVEYCKENFTDQAWAVHMYCEIAHLGGMNNANQVFQECNGKYTLKRIMKVLKKDQKDKIVNEVGDKIYWSRHEVCCEFLEKYAR